VQGTREAHFLHSSPQEAMQAPAEGFLYLACLHEGTGVEAPDFLAVVDAEEGHVVHELPMPNVGDELHHFGWNRCSSACHGPDRSHLIVPDSAPRGSTSSTSPTTRLPRPPRRSRACARSTPPKRRLHHRDLPMTVAHIIGIPVEESVMQLAPAGAAMMTAVAIAGRASLGRLRRRLRHRSPGEDH
jgi:hypothetical protein